ncbi:unnamed protein product [Symbiodinium necroappetens]|uniref:Uncharacterized protein n=1 Tax=Symbiodinium necroappetens TaxID=1628268 RepID=A0A813A9W5_9DINO|nr:unnamed protein product [Symbiodinium necroappetens]
MLSCSKVETDSYFAAANFRRFVLGRNLTAEEPLYLGSLAYWQVHFEPRILYNEQVQCLSRAAVLRMGAVVKAAPKAAAATYARCEVAPGHRGDIMMGLCLAEAGIGPHPDVTDRWGREYFMNFRMEDMAAHAPDNAYGELMADPREITSNAAIHWRGKAQLGKDLVRRLLRSKGFEGNQARFARSHGGSHIIFVAQQFTANPDPRMEAQSVECNKIAVMAQQCAADVREVTNR